MAARRRQAALNAAGVMRNSIDNARGGLTSSSAGQRQIAREDGNGISRGTAEWQQHGRTTRGGGQLRMA